MRRSLVIGWAVMAVAVLVTAGVLAMTPAGLDSNDETTSAEGTADPAADPSAPPGAPDGTLPRGVLDAMDADLGLDEAEATAQLSAEQQAFAVDQSLRGTLAEAYAGAHFEADSGQLVVGITDVEQADAVLEAGADYEVVDNGLDELHQLMTDLDGLAEGYADLSGVNGWYLDPTGNSVVMSVDPARMGAPAEDFVATAQSFGPAVQTETDQQQPQLFAANAVVGGDSFLIDDAVRCSVGFAVEGGFVSAGHCGLPGQHTADGTGRPLGTVQASSFPRDDFSVIDTNPAWSLLPAVMDYSGGQVAVAGAQPALVGSSVCRSGSTSGWHCGTIQAMSQTVVYDEGIVSGLTRTDVCAEAGDSGGPFLSGNQAQGLTSGGSGNCTTGGTTYFQPIGEVLNRYGLTLVTA